MAFRGAVADNAFANGASRGCERKAVLATSHYSPIAVEGTGRRGSLVVKWEVVDCSLRLEDFFD